MSNYEIYLDSNVYISIAKREPGYEYTIAKINNLKKNGFVFPHAPPHAEEVSAWIHSGRDICIAKRFVNLIKKFNCGVGYLPGYANEQETVSLIEMYEIIAHDNPDFRHALQIHKGTLEKIRSGDVSEKDFEMRLIYEDFYECLRRVDAYLDWTAFAKQNDIFFLGRRNKKSLDSNFEKIERSTQSIETFEEVQKKRNFGSRRLSQIDAEKIFDDQDFFEFMKSEFALGGINFNEIPLGSDLMKSHHKK